MKELKKTLINKNSIDKFQNGGLIPIKGFDIADLFIPGNIVLIDGTLGPHHGIVLSQKQSYDIFSIDQIVIITCKENRSPTYWISNLFEKDFPKFKNAGAIILNVYKGPNTSKFISSKEFKELYKEYNLEYIK